MKRKIAVLLVILSIVLGTFVLDHLVFRTFLFSVENRSGWDSFRWYNFEYQMQRLISNAESNPKSDLGKQNEIPKKQILIVGSSIAQYSVQKQKLEELLKPKGQFNIEILSHASMMPSDLVGYKDRIQKIQPDLIVYILTPADLDLERFVPYWEAGPDYSVVSFYHYMEQRLPMLLYYPKRFADSYESSMTSTNWASLSLRDIFYSLRFQSQWYDALKFNLYDSGRKLKSYTNYQGTEISELLFRDGFSGSCFTLPRSALDQTKQNDASELDVEVPFDLYHTADFQVTVSPLDEISQDDVSHACRPHNVSQSNQVTQLNGVGQSFHWKPTKVGWQSIVIPGQSKFIRFSLSHVRTLDGNVIPTTDISQIALGKGLRLLGNLGMKKLPTDSIYLRRRVLEDQRVAEWPDRDLIADYEQRVHPKDWKDPKHIAVQQFNRIRIAKAMLHWREFSEIPQLKSLREFASGEIPTLLINNPENPLSSEGYEKSDWYKSYLDYMRVSGSCFEDLSGYSQMRRFTDPHHLTYDASVELAPLYASAIIQCMQ